jgi:hypothetical protein
VARSKIPNPLHRRHLLRRDLPAAQALGIALAYLEQDRAIEAVDFLVKAEAVDKLEELLEQATEAGDSFLVRAVSAGLRITPDSERWARVAAAADAAGKSLYAGTARRQAEIEES